METLDPGGRMKSVTAHFHVNADTKVVTCCGCGMPVDQNNTRCLVMDPDAYMGTYGPCCAPTGRKLAALRRLHIRRAAGL